MKIPMSVLKQVVGVPAIVASTLLWVVFLALMPPTLGLVGFGTGAAALVLLAAGLGEKAAAPLLAGARTATTAEQAVLSPVLAHVALCGANLEGRRLLVRQMVSAQTPPVQLLGRESLLVTPWLIEAAYRGSLSVKESVALVVYAEGRHRAERYRREVAMLAWMLPWRAGAGLGRGIGRVAGRFPLIRFAWAFRGVIGVVAVVQQVDEGRPAVGVLAGSIVALTYLVPAANDATARRVEAAADEAVVRCGLGPAMVKVLRRYRMPVTLERLHRLDGGGTGSGGSQSPAAGRDTVMISG